MTITKISPIMSPVYATLNFSRPITSGANHSTLRQESQKTNETKATVLACESFRSMSSISSCESEMPPDLRSSSRQKNYGSKKKDPAFCKAWHFLIQKMEGEKVACVSRWLIQISSINHMSHVYLLPICIHYECFISPHLYRSAQGPPWDLPQTPPPGFFKDKMSDRNTTPR